MLAWSDVDQTAAVTSLQNEREACPGCGLRPDQRTQADAVLDRCPGCEARSRLASSIKPDDHGLRVVFETVDDTRDSVWARYDHAGAVWKAKHRDDPPGLIVADPDQPDG